MTDNGQISALERFSNLRASGSLTDDEYEKEKAKILRGAGVPFYRRLWFVVVLTLPVLTWPIAILILITGPIYRRAGGSFVPLVPSARYIYAGGLTLLLVVGIIGAAVAPDTKPAKDTDAAPQTVADQKQPEDNANAPEACDSSDAADSVKGALGNGAASRLVQVTLVDFGHAKELYFDRSTNIRYCQADAVLNTGEAILSYKLFFGPSGDALVEVQEGTDAYGTEDLKTKAARAQQQRAQAAAQQQAAAQTQGSSPQAQSQQTPPQPEQHAPVQQAEGSNDAQSDAQEKQIEERYTPAYQKCEAENDGDNYSVAGEGNCMEAEANAQTRNLQEAYQAAMARLEPAQQAMLRQQQQQWATSLDKQCNFDGPDVGSVGELATPECKLDETIKRIMALEDVR